MNHYEDCFFHFEENRLTIGNSRIERTWDLSAGIPVTASLRNKATSEEWINTNASLPAFLFSFLSNNEKPLACDLKSRVDDDLLIGKKHFIVSMELTYSAYHLRLDTSVYPGTGLLRHMVWLKAAAGNASATGGNDVSGITIASSEPVMLDDNSKKDHVNVTDYVDALAIHAKHCSWRTAALRDQTDKNNNLLSEENGLFYQNEHRHIEGNILFLKNTLHDSGLLWIKESPTRHSQLHYEDGDFLIKGRHLYMTGSGLQLSDLTPDEYIPAYGSAVGVFEGAEYEGLALLHQYHRCVRNYQPERDFYIMSNTWGDRSRDGRVNEAFILSELPVAAELGITHYQIDDGWQQGVTKNSVHKGGQWGEYYSVNSDFWTVHKERFPNGLEPIVEKAHACGIELGLWFSPDSSNDFAHWQKDAEQLLSLYRQYGIRYFKLDGTTIRSKQGELNLLKMMQKVTRESKGEVYFNQDTTSGKRLGYFGQTQYGGLFLENRYTDFGTYYPHWSLRNLWMLSKYVPAQKLQIEFLNVDRNADRYKDDPLAPSRCGIAYAFAVAMFANPLAWMEVTGLSPANQSILRKLIKAYSQVQPHLLSGHILPIGEEPSGTSWSGLQSIVNAREGYVLVFREWNERSSGSFKLWHVNGSNIQVQLVFDSHSFSDHSNTAVEHAAPQYTATINTDGVLTCSLAEPLSFALYKYKNIESE